MYGQNVQAFSTFVGVDGFGVLTGQIYNVIPGESMWGYS